jgi:hypothetical protein
MSKGSLMTFCAQQDMKWAHFLMVGRNLFESHCQYSITSWPGLCHVCVSVFVCVCVCVCVCLYAPFYTYLIDTCGMNKNALIESMCLK